MKKIFKICGYLEEIVAGSLFGVMCLSVFFQMCSRIFFHKALLFSEEISRFCYIWVVFMCISLGEKTFEHFNVTVFLSFLKGIPDQLFSALTSIICFLIHAYLLYWSLQFFDFQRVVKSPAMEIPMSVVAAGLVLGFFLGSIRCLVNGINSIKMIGKKTEGKG